MPIAGPSSRLAKATYRGFTAISRTFTQIYLVSLVSARAIAANEPISFPGLCIDNFRSWLGGSKTGPMTGWGVGNSVPSVFTNHTL